MPEAEDKIWEKAKRINKEKRREQQRHNDCLAADICPKCGGELIPPFASLGAILGGILRVFLMETGSICVICKKKW